MPLYHNPRGQVRGWWSMSDLEFCNALTGLHCFHIGVSAKTRWALFSIKDGTWPGGKSKRHVGKSKDLVLPITSWAI